MGHLGTHLNLPNDEAAVKASCVELVRRYSGWRAPIDLNPILEAFGIKVVKCKLASDAMLILNKGGEIEIRLNRSTPWARNRFSLAHEIAHLVVMNLSERAASDRLLRPENHEALERLCDLGAKEMLMPHSLFSRSVQSLGFNRIGLASLASQFQVSKVAALRRIAELASGSTLLLVSWDDRSASYMSRLSYGSFGRHELTLSRAKAFQEAAFFGELLAKCETTQGLLCDFELSTDHATQDSFQCLATKLGPSRIDEQSELLFPELLSDVDKRKSDGVAYAILIMPKELAKHEGVWQQLRRHSSITYCVT